MLRVVLHDWSDTYCIKILKHLRAAAGPETRLVVLDYVVSYPFEPATKIPGSPSETAPEPLLANMGQANVLPYIADMQVSPFPHLSMQRDTQVYDRRC